jgi:fatty acid synthase subunit alpha, fungi type
VFKLPYEKRGAWLQEHRAEVIQRLKADYFKPWFPMKKDGRVVEGLGDMTYEETVLRLVRLMYVTHEDRWLNLSLRNLAGDWLRHVEECLRPGPPVRGDPSGARCSASFD